MHLFYLPKALEMEDENVRESPQAHLHHALLQLLTMGTLPGIVWGELEQTSESINEIVTQIKY